MTTRISLALLLLILGAAAVDTLAAQGSGSLFLLRKFDELIVGLAFWR